MKRIISQILFIAFLSINTTAQVKETKIFVDASDLKYKINKNIYGHFSEHLGNCIYGGIWVGENSKIPNTNGIRNDVVEAFKKIKVPVLRWPGGCFADEYHWKDGIGLKDKRPTMINTNWGGVTEDNSFGTHEFMELCRQVGCEPYFCGNIGSGTIQEMSQWIEYVNSDNISPMTDLRKSNGREKSWGVKYWGLGNENWGCGGNMTPEYYADQVKRYGTFCKNFGNNRLFKIASGSSGNDYNWTEVLMKNAGSHFDGISVHHYSFANGRTAADFDEQGWFDILNSTLMMEEYVTRHSAIMDKYDPYKRVGLMVDEWGTWYAVESGTNPGFLFQQNTLRDAITAACNFNIFNNHCDRVRMANIAQIVNVLQSVILTKDEKMVLTPTFHVFDLFKVHQDAFKLPVKIETPDYVLGDQKLPAVNCSASIDAEGKVHISLCNIDPKSEEKIVCAINKFAIKNISAQIVTSEKMNAHNTFENPNVVFPQKFSDFKIAGGNLEVVMPAKSVVVLELEGKREIPAAREVKDAKPGISYNYYEGIWDNLPNFDLITPKSTGQVENFIFPKECANENFGTQYKGYIKLPKEGAYQFYVNSDDGSALLVDEEIIVSNDGLHAPVEQSGFKFLSAGFHDLKVVFFQKGGGKVLDVSIEGPGMKKQLIPVGILYH
jgi:alpha-N-arabinofuranosidase